MPAHSKRSAELDARICERLTNGDTLRQICRDEKLSHVTVATWREKDEAFDQRVKAAREAGFDAIAESCIEIADAADEYHSRDGALSAIRDPQRDKLRVWTRMELLKKWDPRRYGELQKVEHSGKLGIERLITESRQADTE